MSPGPRFVLRHPDPDQPYIRAEYWVDMGCCFAEVIEEPHVNSSYWLLTHEYVESVEEGGLIDAYDIWSNQNDTLRPVVGLLTFLARKGFFDLSEVEEAVDFLRTHDIDRLPRRLQRIGRVLRNLDEGLA